MCTKVERTHRKWYISLEENFGVFCFSKSLKKLLIFFSVWYKIYQVRLCRGLCRQSNFDSVWSHSIGQARRPRSLKGQIAEWRLERNRVRTDDWSRRWSSNYFLDESQTRRRHSVPKPNYYSTGIMWLIQRIPKPFIRVLSLQDWSNDAGQCWRRMFIYYESLW